MGRARYHGALARADPRIAREVSRFAFASPEQPQVVGTALAALAGDLASRPRSTWQARLLTVTDRRPRP